MESLSRIIPEKVEVGDLFQNVILSLEFQVMLDQIELIVKKRNIPVSVRFLDRKSSHEKFQTLTTLQKVNVLSGLRDQVQFSMASQDLYGANFEKNLFLKFLKMMNWRMVDSEFIHTIQNDEIIEVYDGNAVQIFRSWNFFQFCSYSLVEILTRDWADLYERPHEITHKLWGIFPKLFTRELTTIRYSNFGINTYLLVEKYIKAEMGFQFTMNRASPIEDSEGQICAFVSTGVVNSIPLDRGSSAEIFFI